MDIHTRRLKLLVSSEFFENYCENGRMTEHTEKAIGYLSQWAIAGQRFGFVSLLCQSDGNISAVYFACEDSTTAGYEIFALRGDDGTYSFHS